MAELKLTDSMFKNAEQPEIDAFVAALAVEQGGRWIPTSDGYAITGLSEKTVADLEDTIMDRIEDELGI